MIQTAVRVAFLPLLVAFFGGAAFADTKRDENDPLVVALPADWFMHWEVEPFSRTWHFAPSKLDDAMFKDDSLDIPLSITVQLDMPAEEFAGKSGRDLADAVSAAKVALYAERSIPLQQGETRAEKVAGTDGCVTTFTVEDGEVEEMYVTAIDRMVFVVTLSIQAKAIPNQVDTARKLVKALKLDRVDPKIKTEMYSDREGKCAIDLPAEWFFGTRRADLQISPFVIDENASVGIGCEIDVAPRIEWIGLPVDLPRNFARDALLDSLKKSDVKGAKVSIARAEDLELSGMKGRLIERCIFDEKGRRAPVHEIVYACEFERITASVTFRAPELQWPRYAASFESALRTLRLNIGVNARSPLLENKRSRLYGDVLLVGDAIGKTLGEEWIPQYNPSMNAAVGWQTNDDERRIALCVVEGTDPQAHARGELAGIPDGWKVLERDEKEIATGHHESSATLEIAPDNVKRMIVRALALPDDRLIVVLATLRPGDAEGWELVQPALDVLSAPAVQPAIGVGNATTVALGGAKIKFTPPKDWRATREKSRSLVGFEQASDAVWLVVRRPEAERCHSWKNEQREQQMLSLGCGVEQVLAEKKLAGGVGGQDIERTTLSTRRGEKPVWRKTRTLHRASVVATLTMELVLEKDAKPAVADKRAAPVFASFKIEGK